MNTDKLYFGRGRADQFDEYIDFINYVFGFNGNEQDFPKLLPKLYRPELNPAGNSFIAMEDGKIKAAVGAFPGEIKVCDQTLKIIGIGNVSVHPYSRSKGYMKKLMTMAVDDMIAQGADLSALSGQRQRYNYFSYDYTGSVYHYTVDTTNLRHAYGNAPLNMTMTEVLPEDSDALDFIAALIEKSPYVAVRSREELYPILRSWEATPYLFTEGDRKVGYCVIQGNAVTEIAAVQDEDFPAMVRAVVAQLKRADFQLPDFQPAYAQVLEGICSQLMITSKEMFSVLNYKRVLEAFLHLKATYTTLPDGELTVLIHGRTGDEHLHITVKDNVITVEDCGTFVESIGSPNFAADIAENITSSDAQQSLPQLELSHLEAMRYFFSPDCVARRTAPDFVKVWFPLPLWIYAADCV